MARRCELTGKEVLYGNNVSHANNKSRRRYLPNLQPVTLISDTLVPLLREHFSRSNSDCSGFNDTDINNELYLLS